MLSTELVVKNLSRAAVPNDECFEFFKSNINNRLIVSSIDFDRGKIDTEHGLFSIVILDGAAVRLLFVWSPAHDVDFELYVGGEKIWPKQ